MSWHDICLCGVYNCIFTTLSKPLQQSQDSKINDDKDVWNTWWARVIEYSPVLATWTIMGSSPKTSTNACGHAMLGYHAHLCTVSRCCTRGESEDHTGEKAHRGSVLALKPRADITSIPKEGYQWPNEKDLCPLKIKKRCLGFIVRFLGQKLGIQSRSCIIWFWRSVWMNQFYWYIQHVTLVKC